MKFWLSKNSEAPIYEQITTQIILAIASGDLSVGERLPSTREISRRFGVHSNTVSNAYRDLVRQGWLEFRKGSGFYVREAKTESLENSLDKIIADFFQTARENGFSFDEIKSRLTRIFESDLPEKILVVESDADLREILIEEICRSTNLRVEGVGLEDFRRNFRSEKAIFVAMFDEKVKIKSVVSADEKCVFLKARSVAESMKGRRRPEKGDLIAVISGWEKFLQMAKTMLLAVGIDEESLLIRSPKKAGWEKGVKTASMIICDSIAAINFPDDSRVRRFEIISDESLSELENICKSVGNPPSEETWSRF